MCCISVEAAELEVKVAALHHAEFWRAIEYIKEATEKN